MTIQVAISSREISTPPTSNWFVSHGYGLDSLLRARADRRVEAVGETEDVRPGELLDARS